MWGFWDACEEAPGPIPTSVFRQPWCSQPRPGQTKETGLWHVSRGEVSDPSDIQGFVDQARKESMQPTG